MANQSLATFLTQQPTVSPSLAGVITTIAECSKQLAWLLRSQGLHQFTGKTGTTNTHGDEVEKLDAFADALLSQTLLQTDLVHAVMSEELPDPQLHKQNKGEYIVCYDPLDGSSNIDTNIDLGTIFSVYSGPSTLLQPGAKQITAGYILYGPATILVLALQENVSMFTLDPTTGTYMQTMDRIQMPKHSQYYATNEGNFEKLFPAEQKYLTLLKKQKTYRLRNVGSMVADIHRTLLKGGIFLYPGDSEHEQGKLRLMFEVNPMSFLVQQAGGRALSNGANPLDIHPHSFAQHAPIVIGSKENVDEYEKIVSKAQ